MEKPNNIVRIPCSFNTNFFKLWLTFLKPFHNLSNRETDIMAEILKHRYDLSKVIKDSKILDKVTLGEDTKREIRESLGLTVSHFQMLMKGLKNHGVVTDTEINPKFIPNVTKENGYFQLLLLYDLQ